MKRLVMLVLTCLWASPPLLAQVRSPMPVLWVTPVATVRPGERNLAAALAPAVWLALQDLGGPGGSGIHLQVLDSQCDSATALKGLFDAMWEEPGHMMIFGGVCPQVTTVLAQSVHALNMVQLTFAASSAAPPDRRRRPPGSFSTVPSDTAFNAALVRLLRHFARARVTLLTQDGERLSQMRKNLVHQLMKANVQIAEVHSVSEDPCVKLQKLKDSKVRIIIAQLEESSASKVLCCAYRLNLFGSRYQWILSSGPDPAWTLDPEGSGCTLHHLHTVMEGSVRFTLRALSDTQTRGVSGRTPLEYEQAYLSAIHKEGTTATYLHGYAYDGVWVMAQAASLIAEQLKHRERLASNRDLPVTQAQAADALLAAVRQTRFEGVTGPVMFQNGERVASIELRQFQATRELLVGQYNTSTQKLHLFLDTLKFSGSGPVQDGLRLQCGSVGPVLYAVVTSVAALVFIATLAILLRSISDPICRRPLDHLLLLGVLLTLSWVPLAGLDEALTPVWLLDSLCSVRLWVLTLGHCVGSGVLFTRSLNLYTHLTHRPDVEKLTGRRPPWPLAAMFLWEVIVLSCWQALDPLTPVELVPESGVEQGQDADASDASDANCCVSANMNLWLTALYACKGAVLGLGCFLACSIATREDAAQEVTRESRRLALSVGVVAVTSGLGALGAFLSSHQPKLHFLLPSLAILTGAASLLLLGVHAKPWPPGLREAERLAAPREISCGVPPPEGAAAPHSPERQGGGLRLLASINRQLRRRRTQLDEEIETIGAVIDGTPPPDCHLHMSYRPGPVSSKPRPATQPPPGPAQRSSTVAQISCRSPPNTPRTSWSDGTEELNSPEHVQRRLSLQLPILHHAYHPIIGGMATSRSSLPGQP